MRRFGLGFGLGVEEEECCCRGMNVLKRDESLTRRAMRLHFGLLRVRFGRRATQSDRFESAVNEPWEQENEENLKGKDRTSRTTRDRQ